MNRITIRKIINYRYDQLAIAINDRQFVISLKPAKEILIHSGETKTCKPSDILSDLLCEKPLTTMSLNNFKKEFPFNLNDVIYRRNFTLDISVGDITELELWHYVVGYTRYLWGCKNTFIKSSFKDEPHKLLLGYIPLASIPMFSKAIEKEYGDIASIPASVQKYVIELIRKRIPRECLGLFIHAFNLGSFLTKIIPDDNMSKIYWTEEGFYQLVKKDGKFTIKIANKDLGPNDIIYLQLYRYVNLDPVLEKYGINPTTLKFYKDIPHCFTLPKMKPLRFNALQDIYVAPKTK